MDLIERIARLLRWLMVRWIAVIERLFGARRRLGTPLSERIDAVAPVVLVPGFANTRHSVREWAGALRADGFDVHVFDDPMQGLGDIPTAAAQLGAFIEGVLDQTQSSEVAVVGYSLGGIVARWWVTMLDGHRRTRLLVTVASPHGGTAGARVHDVMRRGRLVGPLIYRALPEARRQLVAGSEIMRRMTEHPIPATVRVVSIYNPVGDGIIWPISSPALDGAELAPVGATGGRLRARLLGNHFALAHWNGEVYHHIREALLVSGTRASGPTVRTG